MENHEKEILESRVGGFGGSDAKLIAEIGKRGIEKLTESAMDRLRVAMGTSEVRQIAKTPAMIAGHLFEDYICNCLENQKRSFEREKVLSKVIVKNFKTFAHADFFSNGGVLECKFSQSSTEKVVRDYAYQLQWYYLLGAKKVFLCHGWGGVAPFDVEDFKIVEIEKNEEIIEELKKGIACVNELFTIVRKFNVPTEKKWC